MSRSSLSALVIAAALVWHALNVLRPGPAEGRVDSRFATQFYAAMVAWEGGDPYDPAAVESLAAVDDAEGMLVPAAAPPPLLLATTVLLPLGRPAATLVWRALMEAALLAAIGVLYRSWAPLDGTGRRVLPILLAVVGITSAIPVAAWEGRSVPLVLLLALAAATGVERAPYRSGALLGLALGASSAPLLLALVWFSHARWRALAAALGAWLVASLLALPVVAGLHQTGFYAHIVADLASAGASTPSSFGDLSFVHFWRRAVPGPAGGTALVARVGIAISWFAALAGVLVAFRRAPRDPVQTAAQTSALLLLAPLVAVRSSDGDLVLAIPAFTLAVLAVLREWLDRRWLAPLAVALAVLVYEPNPIEAFAARVVTLSHPVALFLVEEVQLVAAVVLLAAMVRLGGAIGDPSRPPPPRVLD